MIVARILFHMVAITLTLNLVDQVLANHYVPLVHLLLDWIRPGHFTVFAFTAACVVNRRPALLLVVLTTAFLLSYQEIRFDLMTLGTAAFLGFLAARAVLALFGPGDVEEGI